MAFAPFFAFGSSTVIMYSSPRDPLERSACSVPWVTLVSYTFALGHSLAICSEQAAAFPIEGPTMQTMRPVTFSDKDDLINSRYEVCTRRAVFDASNKITQSDLVCASVTRLTTSALNSAWLENVATASMCICAFASAVRSSGVRHSSLLLSCSPFTAIDSSSRSRASPASSQLAPPFAERAGARKRALTAFRESTKTLHSTIVGASC
eukprot:4163146-Pyramimonas_sp.AAC.1